MPRRAKTPAIKNDNRIPNGFARVSPKIFSINGTISIAKAEPAFAARLNVPTICVPGGPGIMEIELDSNYKGLNMHNYNTKNDRKRPKSRRG